MEESIKKIEKELLEIEKKLDKVLSDGRIAVRFCSNAIKSIHMGNVPQARKDLEEVDKIVKRLEPDYDDFSNHLDHIYQEYAEAKIVLGVIENKKVPSMDEIKVPTKSYIGGLLDGIGELKREMYEALRKGNKPLATEYFTVMEKIYDELLSLRFSNAVLPDFKRKQDVARSQIEQARGELI